MNEFLLNYLDQILIISTQLLVVLRMISTLKSNVKDTLKQIKKDYIVLENKFKETHDENVLLGKALDKILTYIEIDSESKELSVILPQEIKDKYKDLKDKSLEVHDEIKKLV